MGSCVSFHKAMEPSVKIGGKEDELLVKEEPDAGNGVDTVDTGVPLSYSGFHGGGSKDEAFFDTQPWLDSDCENDFYSVNGDLTPSSGSTPVHHSFHPSQPTAIRHSILLPPNDENTTPEPSPTESRKKRLSELFRESLGGDESYMELPSSEPQKAANGEGGGAPDLRDNDSRSSDGRTPIKEMNGEEKEPKTAQCCIPMLIPSRSMDGRRKKMSPARLVV